jgi:hypothetical protein
LGIEKGKWKKERKENDNGKIFYFVMLSNTDTEKLLVD